MKTLNKYIILSFLCTVPFQIFGQTSPLSPINNLVGHWEGHGWHRLSNGSIIKFNQKEVVSAALQKNLMVVHGKGYSTDSDSLMFEAIAFIYSGDNGQINISAHNNKNQHIITKLMVNKPILTWRIDLPQGGQIKYEMEIKEAQWHETGSYSGDGTTWHQFMEMDLIKQ